MSGITLFFAWNLQFISVDFEFENFFPTNNPDSRFYEIHKKQFGYDNDFLNIVVERKEGLFNEEFLTRINAFEETLTTLRNVDYVTSPLSQKQLIRTPVGPVAFPLVHVDRSDLLAADSVRIFGNDLYSHAFGTNRISMSIFLAHVHFEDQDQSKTLLAEIQQLALDADIGKIRLVGKLPAQNVFIDLIKSDLGKFMIGSIVISLVILLLIYKSLRSALIPFIISILSLIWLFGLTGALGVRINLMSSLLPPILFFVSMSDAVHLMNAFVKAGASTKSNRTDEAISIIWTPTLLTSVTTAIGFLSLLWINTEPIQLLGVLAATGILFAFVITFSLGLIIISAAPLSTARKTIQIPDKFVILLLRNKKKVWIASLVLTGSLIPGILNLKINAYLLDDLPQGSEVRQNFEFMDEIMGGSKPYEIRIEVADSLSGIWEKKVMDEVEKIERYLVNTYPIARVQAPSTVIKYLHQANNGGLNEYFRYPQKKSDYNKAWSLLRQLNPEITERIVTPDGKACRIIGFFPELGSYETAIRNEKLLSYLEEHIDKEVIHYRLTGTTYLIDKSHELLSLNLIKGLLTAIVVIGIVLMLYFRSFKLLIVSMIPNLMPLLLVAGALGWMGISLKITTSIVFTIVFGIAADDTIHMMSFFLKNSAHSARETLKKTCYHAGSSMLITSIIMIAGFSIFLVSDFGATFYLGLFVSLSLFAALIIDMTILPLLLLKIHKNAP